MTGAFTDFGILLGSIIKRRMSLLLGLTETSPTVRMREIYEVTKLGLLFALGVGFFAGGVIGASLTTSIGHDAVLVPMGTSMSIGFGYVAWCVVVFRPSSDEMRKRSSAPA